MQNTKDKRNSEKGYASTDLRVADFLQHRRCQAGVARHDGAAREPPPPPMHEPSVSALKDV